MRKLTLVGLVTILIFSSPSFALVGLRVGANLNFVQPAATIAFDQVSQSESYDPTGYGVTGFAVADLAFLKLTADIGYLNLGEQSYEWMAPGDIPSNMERVSATATVTAVPIMVGLRWQFGLPIGPKAHVGVQAGLHNFTYKIEGEAVETVFVNETNTSSKFSFSPIIGLSWSSVEASLLYMVVEDFNYVGLRVGYSFGFGI